MCRDGSVALDSMTAAATLAAMACTHRDPRPLLALTLGLGLACNPSGGDDTSSSTSEPSTTGPTTTDGPTTAGPTTAGPTTEGPTTAGPTTEGPTTAGPTTEATTAVTTETGETDTSTTGSTTDTGDTTTGALACGEHVEFTASWEAWQAAVEQNGATYFYTLLSGGGGFGPPDFCQYRTTVAVADGSVVERRFEVAEIVGNPPEPCEATFTETGADIGSMGSDYAAAPATVEALYGACCDNVIHIEPADEYTVTFGTDKEGFMHTCYYVANGCADGCDGGPLGPSLEFEKLEFGAPPAP